MSLFVILVLTVSALISPAQGSLTSQNYMTATDVNVANIPRKKMTNAEQARKSYESKKKERENLQEKNVRLTDTLKELLNEKSHLKDTLNRLQALYKKMVHHCEPSLGHESVHSDYTNHGKTVPPNPTPAVVIHTEDSSPPSSTDSTHHCQHSSARSPIRSSVESEDSNQHLISEERERHTGIRDINESVHHSPDNEIRVVTSSSPKKQNSHEFAAQDDTINPNSVTTEIWREASNYIKTVTKWLPLNKNDTHTQKVACTSRKEHATPPNNSKWNFKNRNDQEKWDSGCSDHNGLLLDTTNFHCRSSVISPEGYVHDELCAVRDVCEVSADVSLTIEHVRDIDASSLNLGAMQEVATTAHTTDFNKPEEAPSEQVFVPPPLKKRMLKRVTFNC